MNYLCRLPHCEGTTVRVGIMCRRHWRVVPFSLQSQIRRMILGMQADPRGRGNKTPAWKILGCKAALAVLEAQGKKREMQDEFDRLAIIKKRA